MLFIILGGLLALFSLIAFLHRPKKNDAKLKKIPGLKATDPNEGNNEDIKKAGGMGKFIRDLHQQHGPIVSFWEGKKMAVSISTPELLKTQRQLANQALEILEPFRVLAEDSFALLNGEEVVKRRKLYDHYFMLKGCKSYSAILLEIAHEYINKWKNHSPDDHIPLSKTSFTATLKGILRTSFGNYFKNDDAINHLENLWCQISKGIEDNPKAESAEGQILKKKCAELQEIVKRIIENRQKEEKSSDQNLFIDTLLSEDIKESQRMGDSITFLGAGYEPAGKVFCWLIYQLTLFPEIQENLYQELVSVLGEKPITFEDIPKLIYLRQIIEEALRTCLIPLCVGRITEEEMKLGDYVIPAHTNVYQALGVILNNPDIWPNPEKFDPDRFSSSNSKTRHPYAFKPFGFAGRRQCPGQTYAIIEMSVYLAEWCRQFRFNLVPNQTVNFVWGSMLRPEEEVWISVENRNELI